MFATHPFCRKLHYKTALLTRALKKSTLFGKDEKMKGLHRQIGAIPFFHMQYAFLFFMGTDWLNQAYFGRIMSFFFGEKMWKGTYFGSFISFTIRFTFAANIVIAPCICMASKP